MLGFASAQLNPDALPDGHMENQIGALDRAAFSATLPAPSRCSRGWSRRRVNEQLDSDARALLARQLRALPPGGPGGGAAAPWISVITQLLRDAKICNVDNTQGQVEGASSSGAGRAA
ncbi:MAG: hypothetical protein IPI49_32105, partial [Myxococcales bacterium]|nr:hypothetical protein [Myxococcales bacterium]